jgi:transposase
MPLQQSQPRLKKVLADRGHRGGSVGAVEHVLGWEIEISEKGGKGLRVQWKRWTVERTFAWLNNCRRLSKDYEQWPENHEGVVYVAMIRLMLKRLAD